MTPCDATPTRRGRGDGRASASATPRPESASRLGPCGTTRSSACSTPSLYTAGGERRYTSEDLAHLQRILELREVLGMNLDEIREFLALETRLDELRASYRATKGATSKKAMAEQKATLQEALVLNESLAEQISTKLARMDGFRAKLTSDAQRCRELLTELE